MNTETERHIDKGLERQTDKTKQNKQAGINLYFADIFEEPGEHLLLQGTQKNKQKVIFATGFGAKMLR